MQYNKTIEQMKQQEFPDEVFKLVSQIPPEKFQENNSFTLKDVFINETKQNQQKDKQKIKTFFDATYSYNGLNVLNKHEVNVKYQNQNQQSNEKIELLTNKQLGKQEGQNDYEGLTKPNAFQRPKSQGFNAKNGLEPKTYGYEQNKTQNEGENNNSEKQKDKNQNSQINQPKTEKETQNEPKNSVPNYLKDITIEVGFQLESKNGSKFDAKSAKVLESKKQNAKSSAMLNKQKEKLQIDKIKLASILQIQLQILKLKSTSLNKSMIKQKQQGYQTNYYYSKYSYTSTNYQTNFYTLQNYYLKKLIQKIYYLCELALLKLKSEEIQQQQKTKLIQIEEVQQILREHRGLDPLLTKDTNMLNALLQAIYNTEAGYNAILRGPNDRETIERIEQAGKYDYIDRDDQSVVSALQLIFLRLIYSQKQSISTAKFCKALGIDTGKQEDANELMKTVLDKLERTSKAHDTKNKFDHTLQVYQETFEGHAALTVRCQQCQCASLSTTNFTDVLLPVETSFFACFAATVKEQEVEQQCEKCQKTCKVMQYSSAQSVPDLLCMTLLRLKRNEQGKEVKFPIFLDLEFIKHCNVLELGNGKSVAEMAELFKMVMMPWLFFKVEPRKITVKDKATELLLQNEPFVQHLKIHYQKVTCEDLFTDSEDELLKIPEFTNTPNNLYMLRTIVRQSNDRFCTIALERPNMVDRFQILKFDNQFVQKIENKAEEISAGENCKFFYEKVRSYEHGSSYNLSNFVQNRITEENKK
ncbi:Ubiquitin_carboxyl-terminal hydrolase family protein [Hexamita inflata]|uniref:Ubiquitin_carboxyl-terminal hydrolase family protein n=1 Tax=Hexamita inflata TaxID=28002 RepID=A0ABP1HE23_9EUKA